MPYSKISDLPDAVKKMPHEAADAWMKAFNAAFKQYNGDEGKAAAVAWSAIQKMGYVKKGENWVKAEFVKDLGLKPGEYVHPNDPEQKLVITEQDLLNYVANTEKAINGGLTIPLTVSHPKNEREKIELKEGEIMGVWLDPIELTPYMAFNASDTIKGWIGEGKLTAVSPGIYHDVVTSIGKLPSLIDHVAVTNSPFNIQQSGFIPITAEKFAKAFLFFENSYVSQEQENEGLAAMVKALYEKIIGKSITSLQGENKMELEQLKTEYAKLEAQSKKDVADRDATITKLQAENKAFKDADDKRKADARKLAFENVGKKINELIEAKKFKPEEREKFVKDFETLYDNGVEDAERILFGRFEAVAGFENKLDANKIRVKEEIIDIKTTEGRDKLSAMFDARAKELAAATGGKKSANQCFEQARNEVCEQYGIDVSKL